MTTQNEKELSPWMLKLLYWWTMISIRFSLRKFDIAIVEKIGNRTFIVITPRKSTETEFILCEDIRGKGMPPVDQLIYIKTDGIFIDKCEAVEFYRIWWKLSKVTVTGSDGTRIIGNTSSVKELKELFDSFEISTAKEDAGFEKVFAKKQELNQQEKEQSPQSVIFYQNTSGEFEKLQPTGGFLRTKTLPGQKEDAFPHGGPKRIPVRQTFSVTEDELRIRRDAAKTTWSDLFSNFGSLVKRIRDRINPERREKRRAEVYGSFKPE